MLTPKAASQSIVQAVRKGTRREPHFYSKQRLLGLMTWDNMINFTVATIRNPWDRLVSCWIDKTIDEYHRTWAQYGIGPGDSFETFVRIITAVPHNEADKHWRSQCYDLLHGQRLIADKLCRFETLETDWEIVRQSAAIHCEVGLPQLGHLHATNRAHYSTYYTSELAELVGRYYADDIKEFNYYYSYQCGI